MQKLNPRYKVKLSDKADKDLNNIANYISDELSSPEVAIDLVINFEKTLYKRLDTFPQSYPIHSYLESLGIEYRRTIIGNFTAFYKIDEPKNDDELGLVTINYIVYNKRAIEKIIIPFPERI